MYGSVDKQLMEERIEAYYRDKRSLEYNQHMLNMLHRHRQEAQRDIDNNNFHELEAELKGIAYDKDKVQTSAARSPQEQALENAFAKLERRVGEIDIEIIETGQLIRDIEARTADMEFLINQLNDEARRFVEMRYRDNRSMKAIGHTISLSEMGLWRLREELFRDISMWISYKSC